MPSDPSLLADMQNFTICWWTLWFLTNLLVDTPSNKILISSCCGERRAVKYPICPCPFFYTSFFFPICSEQHRVLPSPSPSSTSAPQRHRRRWLRPSSEPHHVLPPPSPSEQHHSQAGPPPVWTKPTPASRTCPRSICSSRTRRVRVAAPLTVCT